MPNTGWKLLTIANGSWVNKDNALSADDNYASFILSEVGVHPSSALVLIFPDSMSIPFGAQIDDVSYRVRSSVDNDPTNAETDISCQVYKDGVAVGAAFGNVVTESATTREYALGLHSLLWDYDDFGSGFGISIIAELDAADNDNYECRIHAVWANVTFTEVVIIGTGAGTGTFPGLRGSGQGKSIGRGSAVLPGLTGKAHHRVN